MPTWVPLVLGWVLGAALIGAAIFVLTKKHKLGPGGIVMVIVGLVFGGISFWQTVQMTVSPEGEISISLATKQTIDELIENEETLVALFKKAISEARASEPPSDVAMATRQRTRAATSFVSTPPETAGQPFTAFEIYAEWESCAVEKCGERPEVAEAPAVESEQGLEPHTPEETTEYEARFAEFRAEVTENQERQIRAIERLLGIAETQFAASKLTEPPGENAYETYRRVLELDPHNANALAGLERIADKYAEVAREAYRSGRIDKSLSSIEEGLSVAPHDRELLALRNDLEGRLKKKQSYSELRKEERRRTFPTVGESLTEQLEDALSERAQIIKQLRESGFGS